MGPPDWGFYYVIVFAMISYDRERGFRIFFPSIFVSGGVIGCELRMAWGGWDLGKWGMEFAGGVEEKKYCASFLCGCSERKLRMGNGT